MGRIDGIREIHGSFSREQSCPILNILLILAISSAATWY